MDARLPLR